MSKIKIFVAGGRGFIGKNIREQLGSKYDILAPTREILDLTDAAAVLEFFKKNPVDIVINAAASGVTRNAQTSGVGITNLRIFYNLVHAKEYFQRLIMLGSGAEYDKRKSLERVSESAFGDSIPVDEYGFSKYVCAKYAEQVPHITHIRLFGVFGKYEDYTTRFISNVICTGLTNGSIVMNKNTRFDYLYIDDCIRILERCIELPSSERIFNIGSGEPIELRTIAEKIHTKLNLQTDIVVREEGMGNEYTPDITVMKNVLGEIPLTSLDSAIDELIEYYRGMLPDIRREFMHTI